MIKTQVCIIGAGAGGIGCAYRLIKKGVKVVVVDKNADFGGTMVFGGVDGWEPGVSLDGLHTLIREELEKIPGGAHTVEVVPNINIFDRTAGRDWSRHSFAERPWGYSMDMGGVYEDTLGRCTAIRGADGAFIRYQFDGDAFIKAIHNIFEPYKDNLTAFFGYKYKSCRAEGGKVVSVVISDGEREEKIFADYFVDASGDIVLARDAGCAYTIGTEGREEYGEPSADQPDDAINGVTYVFRIAKTDDPDHVDELPEWVQDIDGWGASSAGNCVACFVEYPNGDINVNMLPTIDGREYLSLGDRADEVCRARVYLHWQGLQKKRNMQGYTLKHIFDAGIRESYRLRGKYVLREQDLRRGHVDFKTERVVAIADHALDIHGKGGMCRELEYPYEIPVECAMTNEFDNLFVACRGASFTHIAASSSRLSRAMISMGEGVGEYIAEKLDK